ncbi:hypothetical protein GNIT_0079 [Glaciecola nitratireducens FR1064]|uniref:Uncharacterized protein n=1 Tax=Glaciecola nitratireducens (strain JCM 12485 / KCTC 12276 / FR1064) TaxID=1085623 RepID=G4QEX1_GLANF|nr:hypothetical protein GNIT_0079 [Glaciecola nitratireducens FR1064]
MRNLAILIFITLLPAFLNDALAEQKFGLVNFQTLKNGLRLLLHMNPKLRPLITQSGKSKQLKLTKSSALKV